MKTQEQAFVLFCENGYYRTKIAFGMIVQENTESLFEADRFQLEFAEQMCKTLNKTAGSEYYKIGSSVVKLSDKLG